MNFYACLYGCGMYTIDRITKGFGGIVTTFETLEYRQYTPFTAGSEKRNSHRRQEQSKISEADMKYIKDQMENRNTSDISPDSGVIVSLSAESTNLQLTEAQIKMQAQQDAELETDQTMSGDTGTLSQGTSAAYTGASAQTAPAAGQSPVENINISI